MTAMLLLVFFVLAGAGVLYWLIGQAKFIAEPFNGVLRWLILAVAVIWCMVIVYRLVQGAT